VSRFFEDARSVFETALAAARAGQCSAGLTILVGGESGIHIVTESDWPLESLRLHHGAGAAYRVADRAGRVTVEGSSASLHCRLEQDTPRRVARELLGIRPALLPAGT
jgi:hypothetical protein